METLTVAAVAAVGAKVIIGGVVMGATLCIGFWLARKLTDQIDEQLFLNNKKKHAELGIELA